MGRPVEEVYSLTNAATGITEADGVAAKWSDIWAYQVPTGLAHVLLPQHTFSIYLEDGSAEVGGGTCQVRLVIRDTSEMDEKAFFPPALYVTVKEFQDKDKVAKLNVRESVQVLEKMYITVQAKDDGTIDASDSYFELQTLRVRNSLS